MANFNGSSSFILAGEESTFKTAVTANKDLGILATTDVSEENGTIDVRGIGDRESCALVPGNYGATISVDGTLNSGAILEMFFGQSTDTETTGDYKHTFVDRGTLDIAADAKSYTVQLNLEDSAGTDYTFDYAGVKCNTLDITLEVGNPITFSAELLAATVTTGTTLGTEVKTSTVPLTFAQATLSTGTEGSETSLGQVQSFSISFNNNMSLDDIRELGSREASALIAKNLETTGEFTLTFQNKTEAERFYGSTTPQNTLTDVGIVLNANNGVTLGSGRVDFYIKLLNCQYESLGRTISQDGVVEETYTYRAGNIDDIYFTDAVSTYF